MKKVYFLTTTVCLSQDNDVKLLVTYHRDYSPFYYSDENALFAHQMWYTELLNVELLLEKGGVNLLPSLNEDQKLFIIRKLDKL